MELVMEVEDHFHVTIPDERAERITTVAELYNFLARETRRSNRMPCPTSRAFYSLRRTFTDEFGVDRKRVRPAARLRDLFPAQLRLAVWPRLAAALRMPDLPDADPPRRLPSLRSLRIGIAVAAVVAAILSLALFFVPDRDPRGPIVAAVFVWVGLPLIACEFWGMIWIARYFERRTLPRVRDLVVRLAVRSGGGDSPTPGDPLWADLTALLAKRTGTPAGEMRPEHGFDELVRR
jgi:hypothetical protein